MKQVYSLEDVRTLAKGAYAAGYCAVYEEHPLSDGFDFDDTEQVDELIKRFINTEETR